MNAAQSQTETSPAKERPILFTGQLVRAIREGRKTQTRRVIRPQPLGAPATIGPHLTLDDGRCGFFDEERNYVCPYGGAGGRLWVRETWAIRHCGRHVSLSSETWPLGWPMDRLRYRADMNEAEAWNWRPSIHMPRWASRMNLEVSAIRVEPLQSISLHDLRAEGVLTDQEHEKCLASFTGAKFKHDFWKRRWDAINLKRAPFDDNPWVWVVEFFPDGV